MNTLYSPITRFHPWKIIYEMNNALAPSIYLNNSLIVSIVCLKGPKLHFGGLSESCELLEDNSMALALLFQTTAQWT